ncbi:MAG: hypothetical protein AAFW73_24375 [Bacteroidota bacterium]
MKSRLSKFDLGIQILGMLAFAFLMLSGHLAISTGVLLCLLFLGLWQILSAAFWGLVYADFRRSQFLIVAIFTLGGVGVLLNLPEFRDSEFILLLSRFGAALMVAFYLRLTYREVMGLPSAPHPGTYI